MRRQGHVNHRTSALTVRTGVGVGWDGNNNENKNKCLRSSPFYYESLSNFSRFDHLSIRGRIAHQTLIKEHSTIEFTI